MSADFWAGYISGATGILIGNPLDLIKTRLQAGQSASGSNVAGNGAVTWRSHFDRAGSLVRGASAPILGYGALNALLFVSYNRTLSVLTSRPYQSHETAQAQPIPALWKIYIAGATAGFATFIVSAPTELIKCRAQVSSSSTISSWTVARETWKAEGIRGLYYGGGVTSVRDAVGYGFYFLSYEWSKKALASPDDTPHTEAMKVLLCGGLAGVVTWASIFPLDVVKTRVQTQAFHMQSRPLTNNTESVPLITTSRTEPVVRLSTLAIARRAYETEGMRVFFRGLGICSVRAFVVNAVQWAMYEWVMKMMKPS